MKTGGPLSGAYAPHLEDAPTKVTQESALSVETRRRAALCVVRAAKDAEDKALLLEALGLDDEP